MNRNINGKFSEKDSDFFGTVSLYFRKFLLFRKLDSDLYFRIYFNIVSFNIYCFIHTIILVYLVLLIGINKKLSKNVICNIVEGATI